MARRIVYDGAWIVNRAVEILRAGSYGWSYAVAQARDEAEQKRAEQTNLEALKRGNGRKR